MDLLLLIREYVEREVDGAESSLAGPLTMLAALTFGLTGATFDVKLSFDPTVGFANGSPNRGIVSTVFGFDV